MNEMPCLLECLDCGVKQYRLNMQEKGDRMVQSMIQRGTLPCHKCQSKKMKFRNIKFKVIKELSVVFPNKKVIYTRLDFEEMIQHPDTDSQPYIMWEKKQKEE